ncbi:MAG: hypothetical protein KDC92_15625 [Bacteroidetes bacterium]|nr:hypothetical protein [Bacteroidota bacterium]
MNHQLNPYYFVGSIHDHILTYAANNISANPDPEELADLTYNGLLDYKTSNPDFPDVDMSVRPLIAAAINSVMNPGDTEDSKSIVNVFPDLFNAYYNTFDNVAGITALANSKIQDVFKGDFTEAERIQLLGGLALCPTSVSYWEDVISNVGNPWHAWIETYAGSGTVPSVVKASVWEADVKGFAAGAGAKLGVSILENHVDPLKVFVYGIGSAAGYSIGQLAINAWNLIFGND